MTRRKPLEQSILETIAALSTQLPLDRPVRFELVPRHKHRNMKYHGCTEKDRQGYLITLARNRNPEIVIDTLIHEWAHARAWKHRGLDHGKHWGVEYSRAYRIIVGD